MTSGSFTRHAIDNALTRSGYSFAIHGQSTVSRRGWRPQRAQTRNERTRRRLDKSTPYVAARPSEFNLVEFASPERLNAVFYMLASTGGEAPGIDGIRYEEFSPSEIYAALRKVSALIRDRDYRPHPIRLVRLPKGDGRFRELRLNTIIDRVVAKALQIALDEYFRSRLPRLGQDNWDIYAAIQRNVRQHSAYWLGIDDIRDCFPSASIEAVLECHQQHFSNRDLLWIIETVVRGHDGPEHTTGLYQGSPKSSVAMELLLHTRLEYRLEVEHRGSPQLHRYADNLNFVCRSEREGLEFLQVCQNLLDDQNLSLKNQDGPPVDIREEERKVLGLNLSWRDGRIKFSIPDSAFEDLQEGFTKCCICPKPKETAQAVISGWTHAIGPAFTNVASNSLATRILSLARDCGFTEFHVRELMEIGYRAHQRWLVKSNSTGVSRHV